MVLITPAERRRLRGLLVLVALVCLLGLGISAADTSITTGELDPSAVPIEGP